MAETNHRSRRSVLFVPASNERALAKIASLDCDAVILDLEDAVAPAHKAQAREARSAEPAVGDRHRHSDSDQDRDQGAGPHSG